MVALPTLDRLVIDHDRIAGMTAATSEPLKIQGRVVYCAVYPRGYPPADQLTTDSDGSNHIMVVELEGVVLFHDPVVRTTTTVGRGCPIPPHG